jgi:hypothetical protein
MHFRVNLKFITVAIIPPRKYTAYQFLLQSMEKDIKTIRTDLQQDVWDPVHTSPSGNLDIVFYSEY